MNINTVKTISCRELDKTVVKTYGRPYCFQQQNGCKSRGIHDVYIPSDGYDFENDTVPEIVNGDEMGVSFKAWLERDPKQPLPDPDDSYGLELWWTRNFYPSIDMIMDDLHEKGIIEAGKYTIIIDW